MQPVYLLTGVLSNLFTLALLGTDVYLFREWYRLKDSPYDYVRDDAQRYLIWAIGLVVLALLGGFIINFLLGKSGSDEPTMERSEETTTLDRPVLQPSGHMGALERGNEMAEAVDQFGQAINAAEVTI